MINVLQTIAQSGKICAVYSDRENTEQFDVGYVIAVDDECVLLAAVNPNGKNDGYYLKNLRDVFRIETDTLYLAKIEKLMQNKQVTDAPAADLAHGILAGVLRYLADTHRLCSVYLSDSANGVIGFIQTFNEEYITVGAYDLYGNADGVSYLKTDEIGTVTFGSSDELETEILMN